MTQTNQKKSFEEILAGDDNYSAKDIEVLEGLEPVRRRPGMYIGGTDERAFHHLFAEVLDNAMDEAIAGFATRIEVELAENDTVSVTDNGRGIPVDPHPRFPEKSALEVIMTTLHAGGKFSSKAYQTAGGLHGVGISVVNALSESVEVEITRDKQRFTQSFSRGLVAGPLENEGPVSNRRGTKIRFKPDTEIFGNKLKFRPHRLFSMARSKAYLHRGVEIRWRCASELLPDNSDIPESAILRYPNGLSDQLCEILTGKTLVTQEAFTGRADENSGIGKVEWAIAWTSQGFGEHDSFCRSYCNAILTSEGGTHEAGLRAAITKSLRSYGELKGTKRINILNADDILGGAAVLLSVFIGDPEFQGQTKEKLSSTSAFRLVENAVRDRFDHWLTATPKEADKLLDWAMGQAEQRLRRKREREISRQNATRKLRLPGKLSDCSNSSAQGTEIFIVEGDSAGGSAKQARDRATQAILPLRGKILNVVSAGDNKLTKNQELADLSLALGCGIGKAFRLTDLRYERVVIMTDADVDGAHIAALLMTFFFRQMPGLVRSGHLYLAMPPLYRLSGGGRVFYANDDLHKDTLLAQHFKNRKVEVSRFKGLGEMMPAQLKETTMNPNSRQLAQITLPDGKAGEEADALVETLMGRKAELRFQYIQSNAQFIEELDI